ncbi:hypothetical protein L1049_000328 [Liquidambar formosana]|uniref:Pentatricopeptide repeat-containing protein n=1 Tax=Liquidambar formosana TaxID=63359 RepID=A0AAP0R548_LIQFO
MHPRFQPLKSFSRENVHQKFKFKIPTNPRKDYPDHPISQKTVSNHFSIWNFNGERKPTHNSVNYTKQCVFLPVSGGIEATRLVRSIADSDELAEVRPHPDNHFSIGVQNLLKNKRGSSIEEIDEALDRCGLLLTEDLVLDVLRRHRSDWKPAYLFFNWVSRGGGGSGYSPGSGVYNEILDILGRMKRFEELNQVLDEMSKRNGLINERTFGNCSQ